MSSDSEEIVCRQCNETFPVEQGDCPTCGTDVRNERNLGIVVALGVVVAALAVYAQQWVLTVIAVLFAAAIGYLIYDKRTRIERAKKRRQNEQSTGQPTE